MPAQNIIHLQKKEIFMLIAIFFSALILRMIYFHEYSLTKIYPVLANSDSDAYLSWARDIAGGRFLGNTAFMKWPLYAYVLAFLLKVFRDNLSFIYAFQLILGAVNGVLLYLIGKKVFNRRVGLLAALLYLWHGLFIFYDGLLLYVNLSLFLNACLFLLFLRAQNRLDKKICFILGILLGFCTIAQGNIIIFGVLGILWIIWRKKIHFRRAAYLISLFILGLSLILGAVFFRNYLAEKDFVLLSGNLGLSFFLGNGPEANGKFHSPDYFTSNQEEMFRDSKVLANLDSGRRLKTSEVSQYWLDKSVKFIQQNPKRFLKLFFRKIIYVFSPDEYVHDIEYQLIVGRIKLFKLMLMDLRFILPLSFLGMIFGLKKCRETALLYLILITLAFSIAIFLVTARYRIIIEPYLLLWAAFGLWSLFGYFRDARRKILFVLILTTVLFWMFLNFRAKNDLQGTKNSEFIFERHLIRSIDKENNADLSGAIRELESADKIRSNNRQVIFNLGVIYFRLGNFQAAEEKFLRAIKISPFYVNAYYNLGFLYSQQQRYPEAMAMLLKAIWLDPQAVDAHFELGRVYRALGDQDLARRQFNLALIQINPWRKQERQMIINELSLLEK